MQLKFINLGIKMVNITNLPLTMFSLNCSFSHEAKDAFSASVIFLLVPGVRGGT